LAPDPTSVSLTATGGVLLERERELEALHALIDQAAAGQARLGLIEGPAGIGKTRLVAEARRRAGETGLRVLAAQGGSWSGSFRSVWFGSCSSRAWWRTKRCCWRVRPNRLAPSSSRPGVATQARPTRTRRSLRYTVSTG
jgi:AAA ATPase domain